MPGSYYVKASVTDNKNYKDIEQVISFSVNPLTFAEVKENVSTGLKFNGTLQELGSVTTSTQDADIQYKQDGEDYSYELPEGFSAGSYTVDYKITKTGYTTITGQFNAAIAKADNAIVDFSCADVQYGSSPAPEAQAN